MAAASALGFIGPEARVAGPALFRAAKDTDGLVRNNAIWALSRILPDPQLTIPVLIASLDDVHPIARENAAIGLAKYGQEAKAAVPALLRTLATNRSAGWALKKIDPEAAAKAGVKRRGQRRAGSRGVRRVSRDWSSTAAYAPNLRVPQSGIRTLARQGMAHTLVGVRRFLAFPL